MFWIQSTLRGHFIQPRVWEAKFEFKWEAFMSLQCTTGGWDQAFRVKRSNIEGIVALQHGCCSRSVCYNTCNHKLICTVDAFDFSRSILDSMCSLDLVNVSLAVCILYVDYSLPRESWNCHGCDFFVITYAPSCMRFGGYCRYDNASSFLVWFLFWSFKLCGQEWPSKREMFPMFYLYKQGGHPHGCEKGARMATKWRYQESSMSLIKGD